MPTSLTAYIFSIYTAKMLPLLHKGSPFPVDSGPRSPQRPARSRWRPVATVCWMPIVTASFPGSARTIPSCGGAQIRAWCCSARIQTFAFPAQTLRKGSSKCAPTAPSSKSCAPAQPAQRRKWHLDRGRDDHRLLRAAPSGLCAFGRSVDGRRAGWRLYGVAIGRMFYGESMFSRAATLPRLRSPVWRANLSAGTSA